jgi:hypothetical protein
MDRFWPIAGSHLCDPKSAFAAFESFIKTEVGVIFGSQELG